MEELRQRSNRLPFAFIVLLALWAIFGAIQAHADDVYNFYFQKSPQGTIQNGTQAPGGKAPAVSVTQPKGDAISSPEEAVAVTESRLPEIARSLPKWEIGLGYTWKEGFSFMPAAAPVGGWAGSVQNTKGGVVYFQYNFSSLLGVRGTYAQLKHENSYTGWRAGNVISGFDQGYRSHWNQERDQHIYSGSLVFTPVRIYGKSHDFLTLGTGAGFTRTVAQNFKPFIEPEASLLFSNHLGIRAQFRYVIGNDQDFRGESYRGPDTKMWTAGLVTRF